MKFVASSMLTLYKDCPDGKDGAPYYRFVESVIEQVSLYEGEMPQTAFIS